ncbi:transporter substrate-binding domain-containing protein [Paracoccus denitrificans]|uniref:transporter substrate-binding domain-containing protein n=1 Tax=Paracoccus denitrificans TaxID=266 RepID=UPI000CEBF42C|nr:transporter substrate-binding domain-containing protein [Paracoccus denitrificans]
MTTSNGTFDRAVSRRRLVQLAAAGSVAAAGGMAAGASQAQAQAASSTLAKIRAAKKLRVAALVGEPPYFVKSAVTGEWSGACVEMAKDIAKLLEVEIEFVDSTYGNSVIQLQTDKVDIAMSLTPTPVRSLSVDFSKSYFLHGYGLVAPENVSISTWAGLNNPDIKVAVDLGSTQEMAARRFAPKANITAFATRDEVMLALQTKRVDCAVFAALLGMTAVKKNPNIGKFSMLTEPVIGLPACLAIPKEENADWKSFLDVWVEYNRGIGQMTEWLTNGMKLAGVEPEDIPADVKL